MTLARVFSVAMFVGKPSGEAEADNPAHPDPLILRSRKHDALAG